MSHLDMDYRDFEKLIAHICEDTGKGRKHSVYLHKKYQGKSGQIHDIDVSVEFVELGVRFVVLVECKWWNRPVGIQEVLVLSQRLEDIGAHKGIIVTNVGFEKGAFKFAKARGIALQRWDENEKLETDLPSLSGMEAPLFIGAATVGLFRQNPFLAILIVLILLYLLLHR